MRGSRCLFLRRWRWNCGQGSQRRQTLHHRHRLQAHRDDLGEEADDVFGVVEAVRVVGDAAAFVGAHLVLVNHPFEGGTVAETVLRGLGRDAVQREEVVVGERGLVFGEAHLFRAPVEG